ncbi:hypothetical protein CsSME_00005564 [Camellia sinensis var. sinensis]
MTFYELGEMNDQVRDVVISMTRPCDMFLIDQEREGEEIDQALVKNVLDIYTKMGEGSIEHTIVVEHELLFVFAEKKQLDSEAA